MNPEFKPMIWEISKLERHRNLIGIWTMHIPNGNCHDWKCDWKYVLGYDKSTRAPPICISDAEKTD